MKAQDIYVMASAFLYEREGEDADNRHFALPFLNLLLQEALPTENSIRAFEGRPLLAQAPFLTALGEEVPYADGLTRAALPYGLAAQFFQEAMDNAQAENYRGKYIAALDEARRFSFVESGYGPYGEGDG